MRLIFVSLLYLAIYILCLRLPVISIIKYSTSIAYKSIFVACIATIFSFTLTSSLLHFTFHFERSEKQPRFCGTAECRMSDLFLCLCGFLGFSLVLAVEPAELVHCKRAEERCYNGDEDKDKLGAKPVLAALISLSRAMSLSCR